MPSVTFDVVKAGITSVVLRPMTPPTSADHQQMTTRATSAIHVVLRPNSNVADAELRRRLGRSRCRRGRFGGKVAASPAGGGTTAGGGSGDDGVGEVVVGGLVGLLPSERLGEHRVGRLVRRRVLALVASAGRRRGRSR